MSTLTSSSTVAQVEASYIDNASYAEDASVTKCRAFITATRILIIRLPSTATKGANTLSFSLADLQKQLEGAMEWIDLHSTTATDLPASRVTRADFRQGRA